MHQGTFTTVTQRGMIITHHHTPLPVPEAHVSLTLHGLIAFTCGHATILHFVSFMLVAVDVYKAALLQMGTIFKAALTYDCHMTLIIIHAIQLDPTGTKHATNTSPVDSTAAASHQHRWQHHPFHLVSRRRLAPCNHHPYYPKQQQGTPPSQHQKGCGTRMHGKWSRR